MRAILVEQGTDVVQRVIREVQYAELLIKYFCRDHLAYDVVRIAIEGPAYV